MISQGTISVLFGCHSVVHSALVVRAWRELYGTWPKPWELVCIALHDVGHVGMQYLDDEAQKREHWRLGAELARVLFGPEGFKLCAGHCQSSGFEKSPLYRADKLAWALAPLWWLVWQQIPEPGLNPERQGRVEHAVEFRNWARHNAAKSDPMDTHWAYLELKRGKKLSD